MERTREMWTTGIFNIPKGCPQSRYLFFEIDTKDAEIFSKVINHYFHNGLDCYWHETANGFHFYSLAPIDKQTHWQLIRYLKPLNPLCPLTTLRILPNKYENEEPLWKHSGILWNELIEPMYLIMTDFATHLENQDIAWIKIRYNTCRYPFKEQKEIMNQ